MIEAILDAVSSTGVMPDARRAEYSVELGKNITLHLGPRGLVGGREEPLDGPLTVKASFDGAGEREFAALQRARGVLGDLVPRPRWGGWIGAMYLMICETVAYGALDDTNAVRYSGELGACARRLAAYARDNADGGDALDEVRRLPGRLPDPVVGAALERYLDATDLSFLARHPAMPQHSDLVLNNVGVRAGTRRLLVFDWEDFGEIRLVGADVGLLVGSCLRRMPERMAALRDHGRPVSIAVVIDAGTAPLGLSRDEFWRLMPVYQCAFLELKARRGYAPAVVSRVAADILPLLTTDFETAAKTP